jgi:TonB family protein
MGVEPGNEFLSEDELKSLLERWVAPGPSRVLDKRIETSFAREFSGADGLSQSVLLPERREEVVSMKFCSRCEEEFADRFSFCPVDGSPLTVVQKAVDAPSVTVNKSAPVPASVPTPTPAPPPTSIPTPTESVVTVNSYQENRTEKEAPEWVSAAAVAGGGGSALIKRDEYHLTIMSDTGLVARLGHEMKDTAQQYQLTWPAFKRDPFGFTKRTFVGYGQMFGKFIGNRNVLIAMGVAFLGMIGLVGAVALVDRSSGGASKGGLIAFTIIAAGLLIALFSTWLSKDRGVAVHASGLSTPHLGAASTDSRGVVAAGVAAASVVAMISAFVFLFLIIALVFWFDMKHKQQQQLAENQEELQVEQMFDIPNEQPTPEPGTAGLNKGSGGGSKPKPERAAGGGGGGREEAKPASFGKPPQASLDIPQVVAPDPKPPQVKNPSLPVAATIVADPLLVPPDARVLPYGDYKSKSTDPSSGTGTGNGIGTGQGGGIGPGEGGGLGPGRGGNVGGGDRNDGGGGPGGGGGGDYSRIFTGKEVTQKARLISKPEPQYTEEARKNQTVGTVVLRVVFASNGTVTNIRTVNGLPYGLTERAIAAARMIKFTPASKDGHQVSMWMQLEYNFNLY